MFWSTLLMALQQIRRNVLRSALTMLGIVIGVASVIVLVSIGEGASAQITSEIGKMGKNLIMVHPGASRRRMGAAGSAPPFTLADAKAVAALSGVASVAPTAAASKLVVYGNTNRPTAVTGSSNAYLAVRDYTVEQGRSFTDAELSGGAAVCLLGDTARQELFGTQDALGEWIRLERLPCRVIGLLASKGGSAGGMDQDDLILMPLVTFQRRISGNTDISAMFVSAADGQSQRVTESIQLLLRERRRIARGAVDDFSVNDTQEIAQMVASTTSSMTALLGAIAAVSLLVGGIGIMNIMLVSVTERTREIGIRIAIGALGREVLLQFLTESVVLSLFGGFVGSALGIGGALLASRGMGLPFVWVPETIGLAFAVSVGIGVVFGYLPARKAARLEPIEALRHE